MTTRLNHIRLLPIGAAALAPAVPGNEHGHGHTH